MLILEQFKFRLETSTSRMYASCTMRSGLKCLTGLLLCQLGRRQLAQLVVHQWQQLLGRRRITGFDLR